MTLFLRALVGVMFTSKSCLSTIDADIKKTSQRVNATGATLNWIESKKMFGRDVMTSTDVFLFVLLAKHQGALLVF